MSRLSCRTRRVPTAFGSLYAHVEFVVEPGPALRPAGVWFSTPGKHGDTDLDRVIRALNLGARIAGGGIVVPDPAAVPDARVREVIGRLVDAAASIIDEAGRVAT